MNDDYRKYPHYISDRRPTSGYGERSLINSLMLAARTANCPDSIKAVKVLIEAYRGLKRFQPK